MNREYKFLIAKLNTESTPNVNIANIKVETATIIVEFCRSLPFDHSTFSLNSRFICKRLSDCQWAENVKVSWDLQQRKREKK